MATVLLVNLIAAGTAAGVVAYVISLPLRRLTGQPLPSAQPADASGEDSALWKRAA